MFTAHCLGDVLSLRPLTFALMLIIAGAPAAPSYAGTGSSEPASRTHIRNVVPDFFLDPGDSNENVPRSQTSNANEFAGAVTMNVSMSVQELSHLLEIIPSGKQPTYPFIINSVTDRGLGKRSGLLAGDKILAAFVQGPHVLISADRHGQLFRVTINNPNSNPVPAAAAQSVKLQTTAPPNQIPPVPPVTISKNTDSRTTVSAGVQHSKELLSDAQVNEILSSRQIALLIDDSGSMSTVDCPSLIPDQLVSRWYWCKDQIMRLGESICAPNSELEIVVFNSSYTVAHNVNLDDLGRVFENNEPDGGTHLGKPLEYIFGEHLDKLKNSQNRKPLLVVVITDGCPNDATSVTKALINVTLQDLSAGDLRICFLQIGQDASGSIFLSKLSNDLVSEGAHYRVASMVPFYHLREVGLKRALSETIMGP